MFLPRKPVQPESMTFFLFLGIFDGLGIGGKWVFQLFICWGRRSETALSIVATLSACAEPMAAEKCIDMMLALIVRERGGEKGYVIALLLV